MLIGALLPEARFRSFRMLVLVWAASTRNRGAKCLHKDNLTQSLQRWIVVLPDIGPLLQLSSYWTKWKVPHDGFFKPGDGGLV